MKALLSEELLSSSGHMITGTNTLEQNCSEIIHHLLTINPLFLRRLEMLEVSPAKNEPEEAFYYKVVAQVMRLKQRPLLGINSYM